ncbi:MAG: TonB-dependent receptor [Bryobacteraceae bacterium]|nr:TonB-dependent receptor [Bryobacteraceae bacterium]MDW8377535.1 TonB-dependent receptor [Bryobacterales bacterium]
MLAVCSPTVRLWLWTLCRGLNTWLFLAVWSGCLFGQQTAGSIRFRVLDASGGAISQARLQLISEASERSWQAVTNSQGEAMVSWLPVGLYRARVEAEGFAAVERAGLPVAVNQELLVSFTLQIGGRREVVQVIADVSEVNLASGRSGQVMERKAVQELPLNGRNFLELATLQAGVAPRGPAVTESTPVLPGQQSFSANGLRPQSNNFLLDGVDNNEGGLGAAAAVPSPDALQEFRILTNSYSAEYGRGGGAVVNVLTRSGGNQLHGSLYNFLRNDAFDARNFFSATVPNLTQNQFGATLGGPLRKDKSFFFVSYEGFRRKQGQTASATVLSALERQGDFRQSPVRPRDPLTGQPFPDGVIPASQLHPISQNILRRIPLPNVGRNQLISVEDGILNANQGLARLDHWLSSRHRLQLRYFGQGSDIGKPFTFPPPVTIPGLPYNDFARTHNGLVAYTGALSSAFLVESRLSYGRFESLNNSPNFQIDPVPLGFRFPFSGPANLPMLVLSGLTSYGTSTSTDARRRDNRYQGQNHLAWQRKNHSLKFGAELWWNRFSIREDSNVYGSFNFTGGVSGSTAADLVLGLPSRFTQGKAGTAAYFRSPFLQFYVQDDWRLTPRLTVNLGLRYEWNQTPREQQDRLVAFRPGAQSQRLNGAPAGLLLEGDPGVERILRTTRTNFGPRLGFAWDPFGSTRTSVRGGYGIFFDPLLQVLFTNLAVNVPFTVNAAGTTPRNFADPFSGQSPFRPEAPSLFFPNFLALTTIDPDYRTPYTQHWNLTLEQQLPTGVVVAAGYVGTRGVRLPGTNILNTAEFRPGANAQNIDQRRPFAPAFGPILNFHSRLNSSYHSAQFSASRRYSDNLTLLAAYTFAKTIDEGSFPTGRLAIRIGTLPQNQNDFRAERGLSNFHQQHRFTFSGIWALPVWRSPKNGWQRLLGGWQLASIVTLASGQPFIIQDGSDPNLDGVASDRPDLIRNPNLPKSERTLGRYWDTSAFVRLPTGINRFGNAGRNVVIGPSLANWDGALSKRFAFGERWSATFRWEVFNGFNHPNFANPTGGSPSNDISSPLFGQIQSTIPDNQRIMQLSLRLSF